MTRPWPDWPPSQLDRASYAGAVPRSFWLDDLPPRSAAPPLDHAITADLCIVGGGFTGLWAALQAKAEAPERDVVLLEGGRIGGAASGRNGGFVVASLTHGLGNGVARFAEEMDTLVRLGLENYDGLVADLERYGIECDFEETGELTVALEDHQLEWLDEEHELLERFGQESVRLDQDAVRAALASPTFKGGVWSRRGAGIVHPGKLVEGLRAAAEAAGVRLFEGNHATELKQTATGVRVSVESNSPAAKPTQALGRNIHTVLRGSVDAARVVLATGSHPSLQAAVRRRIAPVYDYILMTQPLTDQQLESIGWSGRQGIGDCANQFHYYRLSADNRILWGGYDAVYRPGGPVDASHDEHDPTFAKLAQHFFTTFPQLRGVRFTHRWGGAIDTCSRFSVFFGTSHGGRVAYASGYTGLGVCASRWGGRVALDLVDGKDTEATRLKYVRSKPTPFPPEPLRAAAIRFTQNRLEAADRRAGQRGLWLRTLDRLGLGFDS